MLDRIQQELPVLSPAEARVARWILAHPRETVGAAVADVAAAARVSQPTVIRFCRRLGAGGFREFRVRLAEAIARPGSYLHRDVQRDDSGTDAIGKVIDRSIQALLDLRAIGADLPYAAVAGRLCSARQVVFAGVGASGHVAADACHKFFRLGLACCATSDVPTMLQLAAIAEADDVLLLVSQSGLSRGVIDAARAGRSRDATVVALTAPGSPLAAEATLLFPLPGDDDSGVYTPTSSRLARLALLDALQVATALRLGDAAESRLRASKNALGAARASISH